jgi:hypothetical protein
MTSMKAQHLTYLASFIIALCITNVSNAQDLLDSLNEALEETTYVVKATFKDTRIVNLQSNETPSKGVLHFVIAHRFGQINGGARTLWGLDNATMRMGFDYGVTDRIAVGLGRSTHQKTYELNIKAKLIQQKTGATNTPISITWFSGLMCNTEILDSPLNERLSSVHQLIISRKFSKNFSLALVPSLVHRNFVDPLDHDVNQFIIGAGGRYKIAPRVSLNAEYNYRLNLAEFDWYDNGLSIGFDIETGGHVFQLHLTNSEGMFERSFLTETKGTWMNGDIFFGFNMSRVFG